MERWEWNDDRGYFADKLTKSQAFLHAVFQQVVLEILTEKVENKYKLYDI